MALGGLLSGALANRLFAATLEYLPFNDFSESRRPWLLWLSEVVYPLPFLAMAILLITSPWRPLSAVQWVVIGTYLIYLLPYVIVSYYERYKYPLIAVAVALVLWGLVRLIYFRHPMEARS